MKCSVYMTEIEEYKKILTILESRQKLHFTTKTDSMKYYLLKLCGMEQFFADSIGGWCSLAWKEKIPDVEIYIDNIAKTVAKWQGYGRDDPKWDEGKFIGKTIQMIDFITLHEFSHQFAGTTDETGINSMCKLVIDFLKDEANVWSFVACPALGSYVTLAQCLSCDDLSKHETCPLFGLRKDMIEGNRQFAPGSYHVSELMNKRKTFFDRKFDTSDAWSGRHAMLLGTAIGWFIERGYEHSEYEFVVPLTEVVALLGLEPDPIDGEITILGHGDIVDFTVGVMYELKTIEVTKYVVNEPKPEHVHQAKCYYTLGMAHEPEKFSAIKDNRISYTSRAKARRGAPAFVEHSLGLGYVNFVEEARTLHRAVMSDTPPPVDCPEWLCRYCDHTTKCREAK